MLDNRNNVRPEGLRDLICGRHFEDESRPNNRLESDARQTRAAQPQRSPSLFLSLHRHGILMPLD